VARGEGRLLRARIRGRRWLVLAALLAAVAPAPLRAGVVYDPGCGQIPVVLKSNTTVYRLPHGFVRAGSDTVRAHGAMLRRGSDYILDPVRGELRMLRDIVPGDTLVVDACWLLAPPPTQLELMSYRPRGAPGWASSSPADSAEAPVPRPEPRWS